MFFLESLDKLWPHAESQTHRQSSSHLSASCDSPSARYIICHGMLRLNFLLPLLITIVLSLSTGRNLTDTDEHKLNARRDLQTGAWINCGAGQDSCGVKGGNIHLGERSLCCQVGGSLPRRVSNPREEINNHKSVNNGGNK